jgi:hypothetical protein
MMNKSLRAAERESSARYRQGLIRVNLQGDIARITPSKMTQAKKEPPFPAA